MNKQNFYLLGAAIVSLVLTTAVIYIPFLSNAFGFERIDFAEYVIALALAFTIIPIIEFTKWIQRNVKKNK